MNKLKEKRIWKASPSQIANINKFIVAGIALIAVIVIQIAIIPGSTKLLRTAFTVFEFILLIPVFHALWACLTIMNTEYLLTSQRLLITSGVLNKETETLELYRVKDFQVQNPLLLRFFKLGNLIMNTSDASDPYVRLSAIKNGEKLLSKMRHYVEECRVAKGVRAFDVQ